MWCRSTKQRRAARRRHQAISIPKWKYYYVPVIITKQELEKAALTPWSQVFRSTCQIAEYAATHNIVELLEDAFEKLKADHGKPTIVWPDC